MPTIRFLQECVVKDLHEGTLNETRFLKDGVYTLPDDAVLHWVNRGKAQVVADIQGAPKVALKRGRPSKTVVQVMENAVAEFMEEGSQRPGSGAPVPAFEKGEMALGMPDTLADYIATQKRRL